MLFAEKLRKLREGAGLSQEGLAQKGGFSVGNVRNYEQGRRLPSFPIVVKLAEALGVDCSAFSGCSDVIAGEVEKPAAKGGKKYPQPKKGGK